MNKLTTFASKALYVLGVLFFLWALYNTLSDFSRITHNKIDLPFIGIVIAASIVTAIAVAAAVFITKRWITNRSFLILLAATAFLLRLGWILWIQTPVESDFAMMYSSAVQAVKGDFSFSQNGYFSAWVYQLGFTMYEALIIRLFGENLFVLKLFNVLFCTGAVILVYKAAAHMFNELCGRIAGVLYAIYPPTILMCSVLTNEYISIFLFYLGFYFLIRRGIFSRHTWLYTGILLALGDLMRPLGSYVLLAVVLYLVVLFLRNEKKEKWEITVKLAGILALFYIIHYVVSYSFIAGGVTQYPLSNRDPLWKFVLGFNYESKGQYSQKDAEYVSQFPIGEERTEAERALVRERLSDKGKVAELFIDKFETMWGSNDASIYWSLESIDRPNLKDIIFKIERVLYSSILLFAAVGIMFLIRKSDNDNPILFALLILGYAAVHFLIEIQTRYRSFIFPSFILLQGYGIYMVFTSLKNKLTRT
jgi:4-amino-4-deoxy-L-arabinose transferase-like glycosyltransferase